MRFSRSASATPGGDGFSGILRDLVLSNITKAGAIGCAGYALAMFGHAWVHRSWDEAFSALGYASLAAIVGGAAFGVKKTNDIVVASEAEKRLDNEHLPSSSVVPAIQREIETQKAERRETPPRGVPLP